jgi:sec-independent protein translocase protein TatA
MDKTLLLLGMGTQEIVVILILALLLFGGKKIPELMRGIGSGIREFNDAKKNVKDHIEEGMKSKDNTTDTTTPKS